MGPCGVVLGVRPWDGAGVTSCVQLLDALCGWARTELLVTKGKELPDHLLGPHWSLLLKGCVPWEGGGLGTACPMTAALQVLPPAQHCSLVSRSGAPGGSSPASAWDYRVPPAQSCGPGGSGAL